MGVTVRYHRGAWWLFIKSHGQRRSKRIGPSKADKTLAEKLAKAIRAKLLAGDLGVFDTPAPSITFAELAAEWTARYPGIRGLRPTTQENYQSFLRQHLLPAFGPLPVSAISPEAIETFIAAKRAPGGSQRYEGKALADSSLRTGLLTLHLILERAVRRGLLANNPLTAVRWRGMPRMESIDPFTPRELRAIVAVAMALRPTLGALLQLWAQSGLRAGEALGLQRADLDPAAGTVLIRRTWTRGRLGPPKTGLVRTASILHPTLDDVATWAPGATAASREVLEALRRLPVTATDPEAFLFAGVAGPAEPMGQMELARLWRRALLAAGVRYRPPEQLRHTWASAMLSRNAPLLYVQAQGGWRSAAVLLRVYARWLPQSPGHPWASQGHPGAEAGGLPGVCLPPNA